jgi:hypothetical protein
VSAIKSTTKSLVRKSLTIFFFSSFGIKFIIISRYQNLLTQARSLRQTIVLV